MPDDVKQIEKTVQEIAGKRSTFICQMKSYRDEHGRVIDERFPVSGVPPEDFVRFSARASIKADFNLTDMGFGVVTGSKKFSVPLPDAANIHGAYTTLSTEYAEAAKKAVVELRADVRKNVADKVGQQTVQEAPASILGPRGALKGSQESRKAPRRRSKRR